VEFRSLSENWFSVWDTIGEGLVDKNMINIGSAKTSAETISIKGPAGHGIARAHGEFTPSVMADVQLGEITIPKVSIRYKGNGTLIGSMESLKKSFKIDLNDGFKGRKKGGLTKLNIHLNSAKTCMNNVLAYRLFEDAGVPGPRTAFARMFITVPDTLSNEYLGLYIIVENIDNNFTNDRYGTSKGVVFKPVTDKLFDYLGDDWNAYIDEYDPKTPLSSQEEQQMIKLCKFVTQSPDKEFSENLEKYFDIDNLARYMAINVLICDLDGILGLALQNIYMYLHPTTFQLSFIPWDHDYSMGEFWQNLKQEQVEQLSIHRPRMDHKYFVGRLFNEPKFKALYLSYLEEFNETLFNPERINDQIRELSPLIRPSYAQESDDLLREFDFTVGWNGLSDDPLDSTYRMYRKPLR
jgi:hypothetical protein